jgi:hypothetical protein
LCQDLKTFCQAILLTRLIKYWEQYFALNWHDQLRACPWPSGLSLKIWLLPSDRDLEAMGIDMEDG